ncbi:unnamed protein product [Adineta ricciae]|nr:unnamed protein product [Adineta ricciae]
MVFSKGQVKNNSSSQTSPTDNENLELKIRAINETNMSLTKANNNLTEDMEKIKKAILLLSKANDNLTTDMKKVNEANALLVDRFNDLEKRCNQLSLHLILSDMFTYLINLLSLSSYGIRTSGISVNKLRECLESSVPNLGTIDDIDISYRQILHRIKDDLARVSFNLNLIDHGHSAQHFKYVLVKISDIMKLIFEQVVNEYKERKEILTHNDLMEDLVQILKTTSLNSSTQSSDDNSIEFK